MSSPEHFEGYVVDIACLRKYPEQDLLARARNHTKACALDGHCMESGYGLVTASGQQVLLEPAVTPRIVELIRQSSQQKGIRAQVSRVEEDGEMKTVQVQEFSAVSTAASEAQDKTRTSREVIMRHLQEGKRGSVEDDLPKNFSKDLVILFRDGVYHGYNGMRQLARLLQEQLPDASFDYVNIQIDGDFGFLEWTAESEHARVRDGADTYVVRDGKIVAQSIHYTVEKK